MSHLSEILKREMESGTPDQAIIKSVMQLMTNLNWRKQQLMNGACRFGFLLVRTTFKNKGDVPFFVTSYDGRRSMIMPEETVNVEQWSGFIRQPQRLGSVGHA